MIKGNEKWRASERERLRISYGTPSARNGAPYCNTGREPSNQRIAPVLSDLLLANEKMTFILDNGSRRSTHFVSCTGEIK